MPRLRRWWRSHPNHQSAAPVIQCTKNHLSYTVCSGPPQVPAEARRPAPASITAVPSGSFRCPRGSFTSSFLHRPAYGVKKESTALPPSEIGIFTTLRLGTTFRTSPSRSPASTALTLPLNESIAITIFMSFFIPHLFKISGPAVFCQYYGHIKQCGILHLSWVQSSPLLQLIQLVLNCFLWRNSRSPVCFRDPLQEK